MTGKTQVTDSYIKKVFVFGCMRRMTRKASLFTVHGGMVDSYPPRFFWMAIRTENIHFFLDKFRVLRGVGLMARFAHPFFKRRVIHLTPRPQG
jgi:hypothetical protein